MGKSDRGIKLCSFCLQSDLVNKNQEKEDMVTCSNCGSNGHPSCLQFTETLTQSVKMYDWECMSCKKCLICSSGKNDKLLLFCDECDRACHSYCLDPPLDKIPIGNWICDICETKTPISTSREQTKTPNSHLRSNSPSSVPRLRNIQNESIDEARSISPDTKSLKTRHSLPIKITIKKPISNKSKKRALSSTPVKNPPFLIVLKPEPIEPKVETFDGKISVEEADTLKFKPDQTIREQFEESKVKSLTSYPKLSTASLEYQNTLLSLNISPPTIKAIYFGDYEIDTWYLAPYPEEYSGQELLFICEFCLKYMKSEYMLTRHKGKCSLRHPPGDEIYKSGNVSVFEVDGRKNRIYCQNLCLLAKMFLDHKTLYYDVEPFLFYVMTEWDIRGYHFVGYFSKEKRTSTNYNLSCIVTLPIHQRKGYGQFLIEFSYLLSEKEGRPGTPEKPLSDLGLLSYRSFWKRKIINFLGNNKFDQLSLCEISDKTFLTVEDIATTLYLIGMLHKTNKNEYFIKINLKVMNEIMKTFSKKLLIQVDPSKLEWLPFLYKGISQLDIENHTLE